MTFEVLLFRTVIRPPWFEGGAVGDMSILRALPAQEITTVASRPWPCSTASIPPATPCAAGDSSSVAVSCSGVVVAFTSAAMMHAMRPAVEAHLQVRDGFFKLALSSSKDVTRRYSSLCEKLDHRLRLGGALLDFPSRPRRALCSPSLTLDRLGAEVETRRSARLRHRKISVCLLVRRGVGASWRSPHASHPAGASDRHP